MWAAPDEKVPSNTSKICGFTSSCTCAKSHPGICFPLKHSIVSNDSVSGQRRSRSDCASAQSHLGICCPHLTWRYSLFWWAHVINIVYIIIHIERTLAWQIFVLLDLSRKGYRAVCKVSMSRLHVWRDSQMTVLLVYWQKTVITVNTRTCTHAHRC